MNAGYSASPQSRKLGLRAGALVALIDPPNDWALTDPPPALEFADAGKVDVIVRFVRRAAEIGIRLPSLERRIFPDGAIWFAWPRRAAGHSSDVTDQAIRDAVLPRGLVDTKVCAIDEDWSGLKVVWRRSERPATPGPATKSGRPRRRPGSG
jgi:hypothetical protein